MRIIVYDVIFDMDHEEIGERDSQRGAHANTIGLEMVHRPRGGLGGARQKQFLE